MLYKSLICKFLLMSLLFISCSNAEVNNLHIDLDNPDEVSILDFADSVKVIQLETTAESAISLYTDQIYHDSLIYIADVRQKKVVCFDTSGKFIRQIGAYGRGAEEHLYFEDVCLDEYNKELIVQEPWGRMVCYNLDGSFKRKIVLPDEIRAYNDLEVINRDTICFLSAGGDYKLVFYSREKDSLIAKLYPGAAPYLMSFYSNRYRYADSLYFYHPFSNDVENITKLKENNISYSWDFGKYNHKQSDLIELQKYLMENKNELSRSRYKMIDLINSDRGVRYYVHRIRESDRYRFAQLLYKNDQHTIVIDKYTGDVKLFLETQEGVKVSGYELKGNMLIMQSGRGLSYIESPNDKYNVVSLSYLAGKNKEIVEQHNPEEDNPYLVIYYLKK